MGAKLVRDDIAKVAWTYEECKRGLRDVRDEEEHTLLLRSKLLEEVGEFIGSVSAQDHIAEAADIMQVLIDTILVKLSGYFTSRAQIIEAVETVRVNKLAECGGFTAGTVWGDGR